MVLMEVAALIISEGVVPFELCGCLGSRFPSWSVKLGAPRLDCQIHDEMRGEKTVGIHLVLTNSGHYCTEAVGENYKRTRKQRNPFFSPLEVQTMHQLPRHYIFLGFIADPIKPPTRDETLYKVERKKMTLKSHREYTVQ